MRRVSNVLLICVMGSMNAWSQEGMDSDDAGIDAGVTFVDAQSQDEVLRQYLLSPPALVDEDQSDEMLYEFMNQKIKWEEND